MDKITELAILKAQNYKLKKWVKILISELDEIYVSSLEIDWRNNECLQEILLKYPDKSAYIVREQ